MSKQNYKGKTDSKDERYEGNNSKFPDQYGKKGRKPRTKFTRGVYNVDDIRANDIRYWNKTEGFNNVTNFSWDRIVGYPQPAELLFTGKGNPISGTINVPEVMRIEFIPGPGYASSPNDGVNRGLAKMMATIRSTLSTSNIGFETADLGIYLASTSSIACLIGYAKRILESYTVWKNRNMVYPRALIEAQGADYTDIYANINTYATRLNAYIDQYNNIGIIDAFDVYDRQYSMAHSIFADEDSELGQLYVFCPTHFYLYDDQGNPASAVCEEIGNLSNPITGMERLLDCIEQALFAWYGSSDLYQLNGTLLRAFKDAPRQSIPYYNKTDVIVPVVEPTFTMQIMNMTILGNVLPESCDIKQDPTTQNYVIWEPQAANFESFRNRSPAYAEYHMLRLFENDPSREDNMELTRLTNFVDYDTGNIFGCGSELVTKVVTFAYDTTSNSLITKAHITSNALWVDGGDSEGTPTNQMINFLSYVNGVQPFRYIPTIHLMFAFNTGMDYTYTYYGTLGDMYNLMYYPKKDWLMLQFVAYQSLWDFKYM